MTSPVPPEILADIFFYLSDNIRALQACALVCSLWSPTARRIIFHEFVITSHLPWSTAQDVPAGFIRRIAPLVRALVIGGYNGLSSEAAQSVFCSMAHHFLGVHTVRFRSRISDQADASIGRWAVFSHIRALSLFDTTFDDNLALFHSLTAFPMLEDLAMDRISVQNTAATLPEAEPLRLRTFKCNSDPVSSLPVGRWLCGARPSRIQILSLVLSPLTQDFVQAALVASRSSLKDLYMHLLPDQVVHPGYNMAAWLPQFTMEMSLTSLTLVLPYVALHDIVGAVTLLRLHSLKFVLLFLSKPHDHTDCEDVLSVMTLPALERVEVVATVVADWYSDDLLRPFGIAWERGILHADVSQRSGRLLAHTEGLFSV